MGLNKSKGNMYPWVTHTWNVIKGKCPHDCIYCYMKEYPQPELHFDEKELKTNLGSGNIIFVGSSCDMWADVIDASWLDAILRHCCFYAFNTYLFQSKNPGRFASDELKLPPNLIFGTTIETNRHYQEITKAPMTWQRMMAMKHLRSYSKMVSIEPIMDFDLNVLVDWMKLINPWFVSIGADSKHHNLPEPSSEKLRQLIEALKPITEVKLKSNLKRLLGQEVCIL